MATAVNRVSTSIVCLTDLQNTLWRLGLPILDRGAVAAHKGRAKLAMLWRTIRGPVLGMTALVGFECLGRDAHRAGLVAGAVVALAILFAWLVNACDLQWTRIDYGTYRNLYGVPAHVATAAEALLQSGIAESQIRVEFLKNDPILFVEESAELSPTKRYDLLVW
jgi:hypothetical protein